jgi:hypothetical protein
MRAFFTSYLSLCAFSAIVSASAITQPPSPFITPAPQYADIELRQATITDSAFIGYYVFPNGSGMLPSTPFHAYTVI